MNASPDDYWYFGIKPCGCVSCAVRDSKGDEVVTAARVAEFIVGGYRVERHPHEFTKNLKKCRCGPHINGEQP